LESDNEEQHSLNENADIEQPIKHDNECNNVCQENKFKRNGQDFARIMHKVNIQPYSSKVVNFVIPEKFLVSKSIKLNVNKSLHKYVSAISTHEVNDNLIANLTFNNNTSKLVHLNKNMKIGWIDKVQVCTDSIPVNDVQQNCEIKDQCVNVMNIENMYKLRKAEIKESDFELSHLDEGNRKLILNVLMNNTEVFSKSYATLGEYPEIVANLHLMHNYPLTAKPYPIAHAAREFAKKEIEELLSAGIISPSNSSYSFPAIFVPKKQNPNSDNKKRSYRMAIDFRLLNDITEPFIIQLPLISDILHSIAGQNWYVTLDCKSAFFQLRVKEEDAEKLSFCTEFGSYKFHRVPFGLKNSSAFFHTVMNKCLSDLKGKHLQFFLDDVVIAHDSLTELLLILQQVFNRLKKFNLTLDPKKLQLFKHKIDYLGYTISKEGFCPSSANVNKVTNFPIPKTIKQIKQFLGMVGYFRSSINNYTNIVQPLINLTKKDVKFVWSAECQKAFDFIQHELLLKPTLKPIDPYKRFYLVTDAPKCAISAILLQRNDQGDFLPIQFFSKKLLPSQMRFPAVKQELYAIYSAVQHFQEHLAGRDFTILSDAKCLSYHLSLHKQPDVIARWLMFLQNFSFKIEHIPGFKNPADFLSRVTNDPPNEPLHLSKEVMTNKQNVIINAVNVHHLFAQNQELKLDNIFQEQQKDSELKEICDLVLEKDYKISKHYCIQESTGILMKIFKKKCNKQNKIFHKIMLPQSLIKSCIQAAHMQHFGIAKTYHLINKYYYWKSMFLDIKNFCLTCDECLKYKCKILPYDSHLIPKNQLQPGARLHIDIVGKLNRSGSRHHFILTVIDSYTRFLEAYPLTNIVTSTIIQCLNSYFSQFGLPQTIVSDNGTSFTSKEFEQFLSALGMQHNKCSIYHPRSNGLVERVHRHMKDSLSCMANEDHNWHEKLLYFKLCYNSSVHSVTGFSPAELFFGRQIRTPFTLEFDSDGFDEYSMYVKNQINYIKSIREQVTENENKYIGKHNAKHAPKCKDDLNVDDYVYVTSFQNPVTFAPKFQGPMKVLKIFLNKNYLLQDVQDPNAKPIKVHREKIYKVPPKRTNIM